VRIVRLLSAGFFLIILTGDVPSLRAAEPTGITVCLPSDQYTQATSEPPVSTAGNGEGFFKQAQTAAEAGDVSRAFQLASCALGSDPHHIEARRVLGYEHVDSKWLTPYGKQMHLAGREWNPKFGWIAPADLPRFEQGERLAGRRWLSGEADRALHENIERGWQIRTDHFLVTTNHSLEAGVELASELEAVYQIWRQLFAGCYLNQQEVRDLFAGKRLPRGQSKPFKVVYYRNRDEYVAALRARQPRIADTLGIYFDTIGTSYFFASEDQEDKAARNATLSHEAVHQMFHESLGKKKDVGELNNFWIVEGIALYFESLQRQANGNFTIGETAAGRLPAAMHRRFVDGYYVPLSELVTLGKQDLQRRTDLAPLYSQMAGLATFLMQYDGGRYREPLAKYLQAVYSGKATDSTLAELCGESYAVLDRQYLEFLRAEQAALAAKTAPQ
jgi:hypothetical protein